jgi:hypothetical protein
MQNLCFNTWSVPKIKILIKFHLVKCKYTRPHLNLGATKTTKNTKPSMKISKVVLRLARTVINMERSLATSK